MADDELQATDPATEIPDLPGEGAEAPAAPEYVSREEFGTLAAQLEDAKRLLNQQAELSRPAYQPQTFQVAGVTPELEEKFRADPYTRWVAGQMLPEFQRRDHAIGTLLHQNDALNTRLAIDEKYGPGTYGKFADSVEAEATLAAQQGRSTKREDLFYAVTGRQGAKLTPVSERVEQEGRRARGREKQSAITETGAPARRAAEPTKKALKDMSFEQVDAQLRAELAAGKKY